MQNFLSFLIFFILPQFITRMNAGAPSDRCGYKYQRNEEPCIADPCCRWLILSRDRGCANKYEGAPETCWNSEEEWELEWNSNHDIKVGN